MLKLSIDQRAGLVRYALDRELSASPIDVVEDQ
jgi:hypothetical protein